jgi:hypothetical protein
MNKSLYCALSFGSISLNSRNILIPCCNVRLDKFNPAQDYSDPLSARLNSNALKYIRKKLKEGRWPSACYNCEMSEKAGVRSMREIYNHELGTTMPEDITIQPENIKYLDLTFDTKCNSKCMTCNASLSTFWEDEYYHIYPNLERTERFIIDRNKVDDLIKTFPNVNRIAFIGGEPTISDHHIYYLQKLIEFNRAKDIKISYVTNLTGIDDNLYNIWKSFKEVQISMSIDGHGKVNDYIRYPFKWDKIESQMRKIIELSSKEDIEGQCRIRCGLSTTVSVLNYQHLPDFLFKFYTVCQDYPNADGYTGSIGAFLNRVSFPDYMQVNLLPKEMRLQTAIKAKKYLDLIQDKNHNQGLADSFRTIISMADDEQITNHVIKKKLKNFISQSDAYRKRHIQDYIPEVWTWLNER